MRKPQTSSQVPKEPVRQQCRTCSFSLKLVKRNPLRPLDSRLTGAYIARPLRCLFAEERTWEACREPWEAAASARADQRLDRAGKEAPSLCQQDKMPYKSCISSLWILLVCK